MPISNHQTQRTAQAERVINSINSTTTAAAQALSLTGRYSVLEENSVVAENAINELVAATSVITNSADIIYQNQTDNAQIFDQNEAFKTATQAFLNQQAGVINAKTQIAALTKGLQKAQTDSIVLVSVIAQQGRNQAQTINKDKYLSLSSEAANLSGILGRLMATDIEYFAISSDLTQLTATQKSLISRAQDSLTRIINNADTQVAEAANSLLNDYNKLDGQISNLAKQSAAVAQARVELNRMNNVASGLIETIERVKNVSSSSQTLARLVNFIPLLFYSWRHMLCGDC